MNEIEIEDILLKGKIKGHNIKRINWDKFNGIIGALILCLIIWYGIIKLAIFLWP